MKMNAAGFWIEPEDYDGELSSSGLIAGGVDDPEAGGVGSIDESSVQHLAGTAIYAFAGFETGSPAAEGNVENGAVTAEAGGEGAGSYCLQIAPTTATTNACWHLKPPSVANGWSAMALHSFAVRFAFKVVVAPGVEERIATGFDSDGTAALWRLFFDPATSTLRLREPDGTLAGSIAIPDVTGWNVAELFMRVGSPTQWTLRLNHSTAIAGVFATDVADLFGGLALGRHAGNANTAYTMQYDNAVIASGFVGPVDVVALVPVADGESWDYTNNYAAVDEIPVSSGDSAVGAGDGKVALARTNRIVGGLGVAQSNSVLAVKGNWYGSE